MPKKIYNRDVEYNVPMILTLTGTNPYKVKHELKIVAQAFLKEHGDLAYERFDGEDLNFERLRDAVQSLPFLAAKKLVVVRDAAGNKALTEQFGNIVKATGKTTDLVIVENKLDKRSAYYKLLKSKTTFKELNDMDERTLAKWLQTYATEQGATLVAADAALLVERLGNNQLMLASEIDKLAAYGPAITRETILKLTEPTPQSTIFELVEAAFSGKTARAMELYDDQRRQKVEPQQILAMLAWQLHVLALVKTAGPRPADEISRSARLNPFVVRKTQSLARSLSLLQLKELVKLVTDCDRRLKSEAIDADEALAFIILKLKPAL